MAPRYMRDELARFIEAGIAEVGEFSYGAPILRFPHRGHRFFCGRYCSIAAGVMVMLGGNHRPDWVTTYPFPAFHEAWPTAAGIPDFHVGRGDVRIGNDVWIGQSALIASGITVGDGAVIAANAVVTKDVPPYAIVGGNPASVIRFRFDDETIEQLRAIRWWDWPPERVGANMHLLLSPDISAFIAANLPIQDRPASAPGPEGAGA